MIGVVDGAIDPIAKPEFMREKDREAARLVDESRRADLVDKGAVIGRRQIGSDGLFHVEAFAEDELRHSTDLNP